MLPPAGSPEPAAHWDAPRPARGTGRLRSSAARPPTRVCAVRGRPRPPLPPGWPYGTGPRPPSKPSRGSGGKKQACARTDGYRHTRTHTRHDRPWKVAASHRAAERFFSPSRSPAAPSGEQLRPSGKAPRRGQAKLSGRAARRRGQPAAPAPPSRPDRTARRGNTNGPRSPSRPGSWRGDGEPGPLPLPGAQPARRRSPPPGPRQPAPRGHGSGLALSSREPATCCARRCRTERGSRLPPPHRQPPPARPPGGNAVSACETRRHGEERLGTPRRSALRGVFPLSAARHGPGTPCNVQRRGRAGEGVLAGSYRERRYRSIAKRLSPAAPSLPSFPPARLLPAPACSAAARSCRRCGLQAQTPAGEGRKRVITPGPLHRPPPGTAGHGTARSAARPRRAGSPGRPPGRRDPRLPPARASAAAGDGRERRAASAGGPGPRPPLPGLHGKVIETSALHCPPNSSSENSLS
ncbi:translation initiation factor IF-2-like [Falco naumanni]|uniref:translation initiation factor IF-2-like n=1 Tax=Falco naumanni TaxID=148594 RepID=UPI001ADE5FB3|nr:translation initiation factor IF-2-like [Falco naumanni]